MKKIFCPTSPLFLGLLLSLLLSHPALGRETGEALVVLRAAGGARVTAASLAGGSARACAEAAASNVGGEVVQTWNALSETGGKIFMRVTSRTRSTEQLVEALRRRPDVLAVSPNHETHALAVPNDPYFLDGSLWGLYAVNAPQAWDTATGDPSVYVAVIDTGIVPWHEDLSRNLAPELSRNFYAPKDDVPPSPGEYADDFGHGVHVAGTIGAIGNNGVGVVGVSWNVRLIALKTLGPGGSGLISFTIDALNHLARLLRERPDMKLAAVNLSLGTYVSLAPKDARGEPYWQALKALDETNRTLLVVAAGNEGLEVGRPVPYTDDATYPPRFRKGQFCYPASFPWLDNMIVVGALDRNYGAPFFSNWSPEYVALSAPGTDVLSAYFPGAKAGEAALNPYYGLMQGTSMATPHVSGAAALLASAYPNLSAPQIKAALLLGANPSHNPIPAPKLNPQNKRLSAYGFLDVKGALDYLSRNPSPSPVPTPEPKPYETPPPSPGDWLGDIAGCNSGFAGAALFAAALARALAARRR